MKRENLADALQQLSDSIIDKVVKTKKAVIVSDALHDQEFSNAMSVMSLKLSSVMCVPLLERGNLLGVLYVGNDSVTQLFDESHLEDFLNTRSPAYKERNLGLRKLTKKQAIDLMMEEPNLIRRPLVVSKGRGVFGYKPEQYEAIVSK